MNGIPRAWPDQLFLANELFFALIFVVVTVRAFHERRRAAVDAALLFGVMALLLFISRTTGAIGIPPATTQAMVTPLILAVPYLMLRLVGDFAGVAWWTLRLAEAAFAVEIVALLRTGGVPLAAVAAYTAIAIGWSSIAFVREARRARGVAARRYGAVAIGNGAAVATLIVVLLAVPPGGGDVAAAIGVTVQLLVLVVGAFYFIGFATPLWLRRLWRDTDLRAFLAGVPGLFALPDTDAVVREVARQARDAMGFDGALIGRQTGTGTLRFAGTAEGYEAPGDQTFGGRAMAAGRALVSFDPSREVPARAALYRERNVKVLVAAPMRAGGEVVGVLVTRSSHVSLFASDDLEMCQLLADQAAAVLANRELIEERERQADRDALTDLLNTRALTTRLDAWIASRGDQEPCALLLMDLDAFAEVNQTFGHTLGDELLVRIARRLSETVSEHALLARWSGDQFAVVLPGEGIAGSEVMAERLLRSFERPFPLADEEIECGVSLGIAAWPDHASDARALVAAAEVALALAKRSANTYAVYPVETQPVRTRRLAMRADLRRAIAGGSIRLAYQPIVSLRSGGLVRLEALARWEDPRRGAVPPAQFVELAERTGLIRPLTDLVLRQALADAREWRRGLPHLRVAVNLSARMFADAGLAGRIETACAETGCDPDVLCFEITESVLMAEPEHARHTIERLRQMGIATAIDDFGTGYSSLAYLQRLPVSGLKIDHSFVMSMSADERSDAIVRATIRLAHELGFEVVAEGVGERAHWDLLAASGCDLGQGFYIGRPMPAEAVRGWLSAWARRAPAKPPRPTPRAARERPLVLVVDDDPAIVSVTRDVLREHGYAVATASNGEEALGIMTSARPDAVLLDIHMPILDGAAFAHELRVRGLDTPFAVMTSGPNAASWAERLEASAHLAKPFAVDQLLSVTHRIAGGAEATS